MIKMRPQVLFRCRAILVSNEIFIRRNSAENQYHRFLWNNWKKRQSNNKNGKLTIASWSFIVSEVNFFLFLFYYLTQFRKLFLCVENDTRWTRIKYANVGIWNAPQSLHERSFFLHFSFIPFYLFPPLSSGWYINIKCEWNWPKRRAHSFTLWTPWASICPFISRMHYYTRKWLTFSVFAVGIETCLPKKIIKMNEKNAICAIQKFQPRL